MTMFSRALAIAVALALSGCAGTGEDVAAEPTAMVGDPNGHVTAPVLLAPLGGIF
ncbi:hypothetical protein [Azospirillum sp. SYSU D00513]|uniref:hypothetical protein n=1 Tax=Azospirillum sp. SYSU D00513 TaxID=2812561 RepID=UPI001A9726CB|nr:hypothetical protein [Azospirillum sp. SYSU D00513]